jgi:hypothetical protein
MVNWSSPEQNFKTPKLSLRNKTSQNNNGHLLLVKFNQSKSVDLNMLKTVKEKRISLDEVIAPDEKTPPDGSPTPSGTAPKPINNLKKKDSFTFGASYGTSPFKSFLETLSPRFSESPRGKPGESPKGTNVYTPPREVLTKSQGERKNATTSTDLKEDLKGLWKKDE